MRIVNETFETITEYDLSKGQLMKAEAIREDASPIDNVTKFAWYDEDYEEVMMYVPYPVLEDTPSQLDRIEAQITYTAMMTGTLFEV